MKLSSAQAKEVVAELVHNSRYPFEKSCIELLRITNSNILDSKDLGHFEREGIDAYTYDSEKNIYGKAFQFKGFEVMEFGSSQKRQCLKSINSFSKSDKSFQEYYLISNLPIIDINIRKEIEDEIKSKVKAKKAILMDSNQFVKLLLSEYRDVVFKSIEDYNQRVISQYQNTVGQDFYYEDVPFLNKSQTLLSNPKAYLFDKSYDPETLEFEFSKWRFIISEFGFGKTSLVQNLISQFNSVGLNCIYLPVSSLSSNGMSSATNMTKEIAELIFESKFDFENNLPQKLLFIIIKKAICSPNEMVIFFDGLDEHNFSYKLQGLKHIFSSFRGFTVPIIISMRKEFWEERHEDIQMVLGKPEKNISKIELVEWSDSNILEFLDLYQKGSSDSGNLNWFKELIKNDQYLERFGDIPKRPLFLKMLLKDLQDGNDATNSISKLYENYFIEKLKIDMIGYYGDTSRPLNIDGGMVTRTKSIMTVLEKTAKKMIDDSEKEVVLREFISEIEIKEELLECNIKDVLEVLMHSVLMPLSSKKLNGFKLKFAHKSYQEYFTSRFLYNEMCSNYQTKIGEGFNYPSTVVNFLESIIKDNS